ncbi:DUF2461 domain-containing protein [Aspergillus mulundensis]|uniref:Uncharacterized protein n=1 Tax=Aspergillus mulundensis TaxID=1810919 RepID=A0A3D8RF88_9EURO|nr:Uncharacterized protein DSM5745_07798 [Aspergillus mulundensis]RDW72626.1 Uncharacterized protein DSM5745_07798 [Aspergillus mulundensis]
MPRSTRAAPATAAATPASAPKRRASARVAGASAAALKKQKSDSAPAAPDNSVKSTAKQSKYFKKDEAAKPKRKAKRTVKPKDDYYESEDADGNTSDTDSEFWRPQAATTAGKEAVSKAVKQFAERRKTKLEAPEDPEEKELWREGVKTGLGPGKEVFIKKPKARDPGDTPYADDTLHPNTMLFLKDLAKHNERQWLKAHDADYRSSKKDWDTFVETLTEKITEQDSTIPELPAKDLVFRIYRDTRFTKDPTPYKTHFSAAWSRTGKKGPYAAYYVHCQPGAAFVGSGLWHPEADKLALLREDIDTNSQGLKTVLREEGLRREFFGGIPDDDDEAVKAFVSQNSESALKTKPKASSPTQFGKVSALHSTVQHSIAFSPEVTTDLIGTKNLPSPGTDSFPLSQGYDLDNENIQLLRLRSFTLGKKVSDADLLSPDAQDKIAALIGIMEPFVTYLNSVVMPDAAGQGNVASDSSDED